MVLRNENSGNRFLNKNWFSILLPSYDINGFAFDSLNIVQMSEVNGVRVSDGG